LFTKKDPGQEEINFVSHRPLIGLGLQLRKLKDAVRLDRAGLILTFLPYWFRVILPDHASKKTTIGSFFQVTP
jgi:hypothetical protein